jgi:Lrp/AsnC family transcriptional regulator for asnA, asnC and gidA
MDDIDRSILSFLQKDGRKHFTEIAKALGIAEGTVRNRVAKLQDDRVLQIIGMVDPQRMGYDAPALVGVSVQPPYLEEVAEEIAAWPEVSYLIMVAGEFDLMVEVMCLDREHLASLLRDRLQQVTGVRRTQSFMILHTYKMANGARPLSSHEKSAREKSYDTV